MHTYLVPHGRRARVTCPRAFECSYGYCHPRWMPARRSRKFGVLWIRGEVAGAVADTLCRSEDLWQSRCGDVSHASDFRWAERCGLPD